MVLGPLEGAVMDNEAWQLRWGQDTVGVLTLEGVDMFWTDCRFEPSTAWPDLKPFIDASRAAWDGTDMDAAIAADEATYALGLELVPEGGGEIITSFLLRIDGDTARFRW